MILFLKNEADAVNYLKHVFHTGSFYPITTYFLISCTVVAFIWTDHLNHLHAAMILGFAALLLILIADKRDQRIANASFRIQLDAVRLLVVASAAESAEVATVRSDHQEASMHAQDISIAKITNGTKKDL